MPIQFPRPTGFEPLYREQLWKALALKSFDVVPAPSFASVGPPLSTFRLGDDTSVGLNIRKPVNVREFKLFYRAPDQTAVINPAASLKDIPDQDSVCNRVLGQQNERIIGVSRDASGTPLGNCVVNVFRTVDNIQVAATISDGSGNWTAYPNQRGPYYFVEYKAGSPDVFGTSPNTNTSTQFTPGQ